MTIKQAIKILEDYQRVVEGVLEIPEHRPVQHAYDIGFLVGLKHAIRMLKGEQ